MNAWPLTVAEALEHWGESPLLVTAGALVGVSFGYFAQRSRFCLRAAVLDFWHRTFHDRLPVWLLAFSATIVTVQLLITLHLLDVSTTRQLATRGSLSGAIVGGLLFGCGMVLARGCSSRMLVLAATGNLRALLAGLVFAVAAQASLGGALSPLREAISTWWTVDGGAARDLGALLGLGRAGALAMAVVWAVAAVVYFSRAKVRSVGAWVSAIGTGLSVALAWWLTYRISRESFEVVPIQAVTFSSPSAEWLMRVLVRPAPAPGFDTGLLPAVFVGSFLAAWWHRELSWQGFGRPLDIPRYIVGAVLMGFGAMLAGGCTVGAGLSGASILSLTAWAAVLSMWIGGGLADRWVTWWEHRTGHGTAHPLVASP